MRPFMETWTGRQFFFDSVVPSAVHIEDVAHHLSMVCRFNGAVSRFYSVAEHCVRVLLHIENHLGGRAAGRVATGSVQAWGRSPSRWGLMHDSSEAFCSDLNRPAKSLDELRGYRSLEDRILRGICQRFELVGQVPRIVKDADLVLLQTERGVLKGKHGLVWEVDALDVKPCAECAKGMGWDPGTAEAAFLSHAKRLGLK